MNERYRVVKFYSMSFETTVVSVTITDKPLQCKIKFEYDDGEIGSVVEGTNNTVEVKCDSEVEDVARNLAEHCTELDEITLQ